MALGLVLIYAPAIYLLLASLNPGMQLGLVAAERVQPDLVPSLLGDHRLFSALSESVIVGLATAVVATPIGLSAALAFRAMGAGAAHSSFSSYSRCSCPARSRASGLSVIFKVVAVKPSWITVAIGHLLWALPFAFTVSLVSLAVGAPEHDRGGARSRREHVARLPRRDLPLMRGGIISSFIFAFLLSFNEYARAYYLVGRQNTLPLAMFGAMNSGSLADHLRAFRRYPGHLVRARGDPSLHRPAPLGAVAATPSKALIRRLGGVFRRACARSANRSWLDARRCSRPLHDERFSRVEFSRVGGQALESSELVIEFGTGLGISI